MTTLRHAPTDLTAAPGGQGVGCRRAAFLLSKFMDTRLGPIDCWWLRTHALICRPCRVYAQQFDLMQGALRRVARWKP